MRRKDFDRDKFILETWPEALESGEYKQAKERLYDQTDEGYCCLGVACKLLNDMRLLKKADWIDETQLPWGVVELLGIGSSGDHKRSNESLANDNDRGKSFKQIAKLIRSIHKKGDWDLENV